VAIYDQDITHSVTCPNEKAEDRPRYSLVVKFVLHPESNEHAPDFQPDLEATRVGSAAVDARPDYAKRTVPQLKALLRDRGLRVGGKKAELIHRLVNAR
jgi:hypothetical protein